MTAPTPKQKSLALTIIGAVFIYGLGHIYLGFVRKGVIILVAGFAISIALSYFLGWWGTLPTLAFWVWQLYDAIKTYRRMHSPATPA